MSQIISERLVELLDRKYEFVMQSSHETFMLDLKQFFDFLTEDNLVKDFAYKVLNSFIDAFDRYMVRLSAEKDELVELKRRFLELHPGQDDTAKARAPENRDPFRYQLSFAEFDDIVKNPSRTKIPPLEQDTYDDRTDAGRLIYILRIKINTFEDERKRKIETKLKKGFAALEKRHKHLHTEWVNTCRVSPGHALVNLDRIIKLINPEPEDRSDWVDLSFPELVTRELARFMELDRHEWVKDATYGPVSDSAEHHPKNLSIEQIQEKLVPLKQDLRRAYEAIRQEIGTSLLRFQLINRYKVRSQWYNQDYLRGLVQKPGGGYERAREDLLTKDLALFLYDQGLPVLYRARFGKHEIDLVQAEGSEPVLVEAKAYKDAGAKRDIIAGVAQVHSYLSSYDAYKDISEAYYVIYRLGGPIYELPRKISTSRFTIHPLLIDLGLGRESGRKQKPPVVITLDEILAEVKAEEL